MSTQTPEKNESLFIINTQVILSKNLTSRLKNIIKVIFAIVVAFSSTNNIQAQTTKKMKVLFVLTSHNQLGNTGKKTGFWIEEFATPYYFFTDKNIKVVIATPNGGQAPIDPKSNEAGFQTEATKRYYADAKTTPPAPPRCS